MEHYAANYGEAPRMERIKGFLVRIGRETLQQIGQADLNPHEGQLRGRAAPMDYDVKIAYPLEVPDTPNPIED